MIIFTTDFYNFFPFLLTPKPPKIPARQDFFPSVPTRWCLARGEPLQEESAVGRKRLGLGGSLAGALVWGCRSLRTINLSKKGHQGPGEALTEGRRCHFVPLCFLTGN